MTEWIFPRWRGGRTRRLTDRSKYSAGHPSVGEEGKREKRNQVILSQRRRRRNSWAGNNKLLGVAVVQAPGCDDNCPGRDL